MNNFLSENERNDIIDIDRCGMLQSNSDVTADNLDNDDENHEIDDLK